MKPTWKPIAPKGCRLCANCGWRIAVYGSDYCPVCPGRAAEIGKPSAPKRRLSRREKEKRVAEYLYAVGFVPDQNGNFVGSAGRGEPA